MKHPIIIITFMLLAIAANTKAQSSFSMSCQDTALSCSGNCTLLYNCSITNNDCCNSINCTQIIETANLPQGWSATMCNPNGCFGTGTTSNTFIIAGGSTVTAKFEIHIGTNQGTGNVLVRFENAGNTSDVVSFNITGTTNSATTIADNSALPTFYLSNFPNPFTAFTTIKYNLEKPDGKLFITDIAGKTIKEISINKTKGEVILNEKLNAGVYFCSLYQHNKLIASEKLFVQ